MKNNILYLLQKVKNDPELLKKVTIILLLFSIIGIGVITYFGNSDGKSSDILSAEKISDSAEATNREESGALVEDLSESFETSTHAALIYIDVAGAVSNPGVITLKPESRVFEAIEAAGGLTKEANTNSINRAAVLNDGERIYIPTNDEFNKVENDDPSFGNPESVAATESTNNPSSSSKKNTDKKNSEKININSADSTELQILNGVGPSTAQKIIDYRESNGKFKKIEDIKNVSGIGDKTFEKLKNYITV